MYDWNGIQIDVCGNHGIFLRSISKYINARYIEAGCANADISVEVNNVEGGFSPAYSEADLIKDLELMVEPVMKIEIYAKDYVLWYKYGDKALLEIDAGKNRMLVELRDMPFEFEYYNILIFFLHPLGNLLENFGFFRIHSSCSAVGSRALLITGESGVGKSTAGFAVLPYGGTLIADDLTYIRASEYGYRASSLSALVKLRDDSIKRFYPDMRDKKIDCRYMDETYFNKHDLNGYESDEITLCGIAILKREDNQETEYSAISPTKVVPHMFPSTLSLNIPDFAERKFNFIMDMLNDLETYEINIGTDMDLYFKKFREVLKGALSGE